MAYSFDKSFEMESALSFTLLYFVQVRELLSYLSNGYFNKGPDEDIDARSLVLNYRHFYGIFQALFTIIVDTENVVKKADQFPDDDSVNEPASSVPASNG